MKKRNILIITYIVIGLAYAIYAHYFGNQTYKGFAYHLGQGIVWPAVMFPALGKIIGGIIILAFIAIVIAS